VIIHDKDFLHCFSGAFFGRWWGFAGLLTGDGDSNGNGGSGAFRSLHLNRPPDQAGTFLHAQDTQARFLGPGNAFSVITDGERKFAGLLRHRYFNPVGIGVPQDIRKGFLKDAKNGSGLLLVEDNVIDKASALADNAGSGFKLTRLPFNCFQQPQVVQDARP
jgi:hypothetical protein